MYGFLFEQLRIATTHERFGSLAHRAFPQPMRHENEHLDIESRKGRLNLAQDAVLGWHAPWKSPVGTIEKYS